MWIILGSPRAETRHHGEILSYGNSFPPTFPEVLLAHASPNDWPIVTHAIMTSSRQYKCGARNNYVRIWYWTPISWTSSDHGDYRDVSFPLSGNRVYNSNRRSSLIELSRDITEKFSVMGMIFNPAVREARGSLYKLHTSEIEHTSFPPIAALIGRAHSWLVEISQWASKPQVYLICIFGQCLQSSGKVSVLTQPGPSLNHHSTRKAGQIAESCPNGQCKSSVIVHLP